MMLAPLDGCDLTRDDQGEHLATTGVFRVRLTRAGRILRLDLEFDGDSGRLVAESDGRVVDRADLTAGRQWTGLDVHTLAAGAEITFRVLDEIGSPARGVRLRQALLADTWGPAQRKRLKCYLPFSQATVTAEDFKVYPCVCPSWLKADGVMGTTKTEPLPLIWNGPRFTQTRQLFLDGRYDELCRAEICPYLTGEARDAAPVDEQVIEAVNEGRTVLDYGVKLLCHGVDRGCNLSCTMCREQKILPDDDNVTRALRDVNDTIEMGSLIALAWSSAGEVLAMKKIVEAMESDIFSSRGISLALTTNLTTFNERMAARIGHNALQVTFSADGCSSEIYDAIRVGGDWNEIAENMRVVAQMRRDGRVSSVIWNYTVQRANVSDVGKAIRLTEELGFDQIRINPQLGALSRTNGNMFEELDIDALDALYIELERAQAFSKPFVLLSLTGMRDRRYLTPAFRLEMAEHLYNRELHTTTDVVSRINGHGKALRVLKRLVDDVTQSKVEWPTQVSESTQKFLAHVSDPANRVWRQRWDEAYAMGRLKFDWPRAEQRIRVEQAIIEQVRAVLAPVACLE